MKKRLKRGSFLLEIFLGLLVLGFIAQQTFVYQASKKEQTDIEDSITKISTIVSYGIYDIFKGYTTSGGGVCSSAYDVKNISAKRVALCSKIPFETMDVVPLDEPPLPEDEGLSDDDKDGTNSYFSFLDNYADGVHGCKVFIDDFDDFTVRLFIDCTGLNPKLHKMMEQKITKQLEKSLELIYKNRYLEAISFDELVGGTAEDGLLILEFQK